MKAKKRTRGKIKIMNVCYQTFHELAFAFRGGNWGTQASAIEFVWFLLLCMLSAESKYAVTTVLSQRFYRFLCSVKKI